MAYSSGGVIAAADYNTFVGSNNTTAGTINYVWSTGNGQYGYGQTGVPTVSATGVVTATQWATAINVLDNILTHQTGSGASNIALPTSGSLITYLSALSGNISAINTNHLNFGSQGATVTGSVFSPTLVAINNATYNQTFATRTITFASADQARYFFNAGGQFNLVISSVTNNDNTQRSADAITTISTNFGGFTAFRAITNNQRSGSGGTLAGGGYTSGYNGLTTANATIATVTTSNTTYTTDSVSCLVKSNGTIGSNGDNGTIITLYLNYTSSHTSIVNDTLNVTVNHRVDVVYPETTFLGNTWGAVTIA